MEVHVWLPESASPGMSGSAEASVERLCDLCDSLHGALQEADMLGRSCARRSGMLRTLFRLIDLDSARLSLRVAELCLAVSFLCKCGCLLPSLSLGHVGSRAPKYRMKMSFSFCTFPAAGCQRKQPAQHL